MTNIMSEVLKSLLKLLNYRNAHLLIVLVGRFLFGEFVRDFGLVFAFLFEVLTVQIQEEIHHFAGSEGGIGIKIVNKYFVNTLAFP